MEAVVSIQKVFNIKEVGAISTGTVKSGTLKIGMAMSLNGVALLVKTMEIDHQRIEEADAGQSIGFSLSESDYEAVKSIAGTDVTFSG